MYGMSRADQLEMIVWMLVIATVAFLILCVAMAARTPALADSERMPFSQADLGTPGAFREPADPSYVDTLIRVRGSAPIIYGPAPLVSDIADDEPAIERSHVYNPDSVYHVTLADLIEGARYVVPISPARPPRHGSGVVDTATRESATAGRHRAPELIAA